MNGPDAPKMPMFARVQDRATIVRQRAQALADLAESVTGKIIGHAPQPERGAGQIAKTAVTSPALEEAEITLERAMEELGRIEGALTRLARELPGGGADDPRAERAALAIR